jgi:DnaJ-class molecular chaperone
MAQRTACPECNGKGWKEISCTKPDTAQVCGLCNGSGMTTVDTQCPGCRGTGRIEVRTVEQQKCWHCRGTGLYPVPESL